VFFRREFFFVFRRVFFFDSVVSHLGERFPPSAVQYLLSYFQILVYFGFSSSWNQT